MLWRFEGRVIGLPDLFLVYLGLKSNLEKRDPYNQNFGLEYTKGNPKSFRFSDQMRPYVTQDHSKV